MSLLAMANPVARDARSRKLIRWVARAQGPVLGGGPSSPRVRFGSAAWVFAVLWNQHRCSRVSGNTSRREPAHAAAGGSRRCGPRRAEWGSPTAVGEVELAAVRGGGG